MDNELRQRSAVDANKNQNVKSNEQVDSGKAYHNDKNKRKEDIVYGRIHNKSNGRVFVICLIKYYNQGWNSTVNSGIVEKFR